MIREIRATDWPAILAIQAAAYPAEQLERLEALQSIWQVSPATCWVDERGRQVAGYLLAHPAMRDELLPLGTVWKELPANTDTLFLHDLAVDPAARQTGVARQLAEAALGYAWANEFETVWLVAVHESHRFWNRMGFEEIDPTGQLAAALHSFTTIGERRVMVSRLG